MLQLTQRPFWLDGQTPVNLDHVHRSGLLQSCEEQPECTAKYWVSFLLPRYHMHPHICFSCWIFDMLLLLFSVLGLLPIRPPPAWVPHHCVPRVNLTLMKMHLVSLVSQWMDPFGLRFFDWFWMRATLGCRNQPQMEELRVSQAIKYL